MEEYIKNYDNFETTVVFNFPVGSGGIGDCVNYFTIAEGICIHHGIKICYLKHDIPLEKYIILNHEKMYINKDQINASRIISNSEEILSGLPQNIYNIASPRVFYNCCDKTNRVEVYDLFHFSKDTVLNSERILLGINHSPYISIHLRLGDKYLETDKQFIQCPDDTRSYDEDALCKFIENKIDKQTIMFFCDNKEYKLKIKNKYNKIIIADSDVGHSSLYNTSEHQVLDAISEFYLLSESETIYAASRSGFSRMASRFKNIPLLNI
jgi:hypothetical protein